MVPVIHKKTRTTLEKHHKKIEHIFVLGLLIVVIFGAVIIEFSKNAPNKIIVDTSIQNLELNDLESSYMNFWQKFNSVAAIYSNENKEHLVSQNQIERFKLQFINQFNLVMDDDNFLYYSNDKLVNVNTLFCYLKNYKPKLSDQSAAIKLCKD